MARMRKIKRAELTNLLQHNSRTAKRKADHIDTGRAHLNRRLSPDRQGRELDFFKERMNQIDVGRERKNRVVCVEWIVTAPRSIAPSDVDRFFDVVYAHLCKKYGGEQNVISCYQHGDEDGAVHIHIDVLPLVKNPDGSDRLNAKLLLDDKKSKHLSNWHNQVDAALVAAGFPPTQNGATRAHGKNRTVADLKRQESGEYQRELDALEREQTNRKIKLNRKEDKDYEIIR